MLIFLSLIEVHKWAQLGNFKNIRHSLGHTAKEGVCGEAGFSRIKYQKCFFTIYVASYFVRQTRPHILCFGKPESKSLSTADAQTFLSPYTDRGTADQFRLILSLHGIVGNIPKIQNS